MDIKETLIAQIASAFAQRPYPGDTHIIGSDQGDEPVWVEQAFVGKTAWRVIDPAFLDWAPEGLSSALSFFSPEAFRFYIPAYMIADIRNQLGCVTPFFHLTYGLCEPTKSELINPRLSKRTCYEYAKNKFDPFTPLEAQAIVSYLEFAKELNEFNKKDINEALATYWRGRAELIT